MINTPAITNAIDKPIPNQQTDIDNKRATTNAKSNMTVEETDIVPPYALLTLLPYVFLLIISISTITMSATSITAVSGVMNTLIGFGG